MFSAPPSLYLGIPMFVVTIVSISIIIPLVLFWVVVRPILRSVAQTRSLRQHGHAAQATIIRVWTTGVQINDQPQVGLMLEVAPQDAPRYHVETRSIVSLVQLSQVQPGMVVPIKIDPLNLSRVALDLA